MLPMHTHVHTHTHAHTLCISVRKARAWRGCVVPGIHSDMHHRAALTQRHAPSCTQAPSNPFTLDCNLAADIVLHTSHAYVYVHSTHSIATCLPSNHLGSRTNAYTGRPQSGHTGRPQAAVACSCSYVYVCTCWLSDII